MPLIPIFLLSLLLRERAGELTQQKRALQITQTMLNTPTKRLRLRDILHANLDRYGQCMGRLEHRSPYPSSYTTSSSHPANSTPATTSLKRGVVLKRPCNSHRIPRLQPPTRPQITMQPNKRKPQQRRTIERNRPIRSRRIQTTLRRPLPATLPTLQRRTNILNIRFPQPVFRHTGH